MTGPDQDWGQVQLADHIDRFVMRAVKPEVVRQAGIRSFDPETDTLPEGCPDYFAKFGTGILFPWTDADGITQWRFRPDKGLRDGKYLSPKGDDSPALGAVIPVTDDTHTVVIVEGDIQPYAVASYIEPGYAVYKVPGCRGWSKHNVATPGLEVVEDLKVIVMLDADAATNLSVYTAGIKLKEACEVEGAASTLFARLLGASGTAGIDDVLGKRIEGKRANHLARLLSSAKVKPADTKPQAEKNGHRPSGAANGHRAEQASESKPCSLEHAHDVFRKWLGDGYDQDAINATLATAAVERLDGDPLWLLVISGSGNAKTETVQALTGAGATLTSSIASEGALLSGTSAKEVGENATGGLLREIGNRGVLVIKDVTSILSTSRDARAQVLAALREVYDGRWNRPVGTDGGRTLDWAGRLAVIGAVTTAWDTAHEVIATMGDRFVLIRMDSNDDGTRVSAGRQAIANTGSEIQMRAELAEVAGGVIAGIATPGIELTEDESERLLRAANLVTRARTGVEYDHRGNVIGAHAPEMPTRFAKQLQQVVRGAVAIGVPRPEALRLAIRCARDSMPPLRLAIVDDLSKHPNSTPSDTRRRVNMPRTTIDRQMQALHQLRVIDVFEEETEFAGKPVTRWHYSLSAGIDPSTLTPEPSPDLAGGAYREKSSNNHDSKYFPYSGVAKSGEGAEGNDGDDAAPGSGPGTGPTPPSTPSPGGTRLALDLETTGTDLWSRGPSFVRIAGIRRDGGEVETSTDIDSTARLIQSSHQVIGHNLTGFDLLALARYHGLDIHEMADRGAIRDTLIMASLTYPPPARMTGQIENMYGLDALGERFLGEGKHGDLKKLAKEFGGYDRIPLDDPRYIEYLHRDVIVTDRLVDHFPWTPYAEREHRVAAIAARISLNGFRVDVPELMRRRDHIREVKARGVKELQGKYGLPTHTKDGRREVAAPLSTEAGRAAICKAFEDLGVERMPETNTGKPKVSVDAMDEVITDYGHLPGVPELAQTIKEQVGQRTIYETISDYLVDDRVHPSINFRQASGRWSVTKPGMTVIGKRDGRVHERAVFLPEPGEVLLAFDLSQVDMRAVAALSQDTEYMKLFEMDERTGKPRDSHTEIAIRVFGDASMRQQAKVIGHGYNYGLSVNGMVRNGVERELAVRFDREMKANFPRLNEWKMEVRRQAEAGELLDNGFGRKMKANPDRAWTQAPALMGQGCARDLMMNGLLQLPPSILPMLRVQVHDEIVLSVPVEAVEDVRRTVIDALSFTWHGVQILADSSEPGINWADSYEKPEERKHAA